MAFNTVANQQLHGLMRSDPGDGVYKRHPQPREPMPATLTMPRSSVIPEILRTPESHVEGRVPAVFFGEKSWLQELARLNAFASDGSITFSRQVVQQQAQQKAAPDSMLLRTRIAKDAIRNDWHRFYS